MKCKIIATTNLNTGYYISTYRVIELEPDGIQKPFESVVSDVNGTIADQDVYKTFQEALTGHIDMVRKWIFNASELPR